MQTKPRGARRSIRVVVMLVAWLLLAACGQSGNGSADPNAPVTNTGSAAPVDPNAPVTNTSAVPVDPNAPVTGMPGQPGGGSVGPGVSGRVVDAAGQPIAGVLVVPQSTDSPPQALPEIAVMTNEQGAYQWSLPTGAYTLTFTAEGYTETSEPVTVVQGQPVTLDVTLQRP